LIVHLDNLVSEGPITSTTADLRHHDNRYNAVDTSIDVDPYLNSFSNHDVTLNEQQDNFGEDDDGNDIETKTSWTIIVGDIQWCKTNRGNDRMCMAGFTYDYMSQSLKQNHRSFRCSKKNSGCQSIVKVFIDSNTYKNSTNFHNFTRKK